MLAADICQPGYLDSVIAAIQPVAKETRGFPGDKIHNCVIANTRRVASQIRESEPVLRQLVQTGSVKVVAPDYALDTGIVTPLEEPSLAQGANTILQRTRSGPPV